MSVGKFSGRSSDISRIIIFCRQYPLAGGRTVFVKRLVESLKGKFLFEVFTYPDAGISYSDDSERAKLLYYVRSYAFLQRLKRKGSVDLIIGTGQSSLGALWYAKMHGIPSLFNASGIRPFRKSDFDMHITAFPVVKKKRRLFLWRLFSIPGIVLKKSYDVVSVYLASLIVVPSESSERHFLRSCSCRSKLLNIPEGIPTDYLMARSRSRKELFFSGKKRRVAFYLTSKELFLDVLAGLNSSEYSLFYVSTRDIFFVDSRGVFVKTELRLRDLLPTLDALFVAHAGVEWHSTSTIEAAFCGVPMFAPDIGWWHDEFRKYPEFLLKDLTREGICSRIVEFYAHRKKFLASQKRMRRDMLKTYDFQRMLDVWESLLRERALKK